MEIIELSSGLRKSVIVKEVEDEDFKTLTKKRYSFSWKDLKHAAKIYKLQIAGEDDIIGVLGLIDVPVEKE